MERFSKRCGAGREELLGLHRLWVLATEPEAPKVEPGPPEPGPAEAGAERSRPDRPASERSGPDKPEPAAEPAPVGRPWWRSPRLVGVWVALVVGAGLLGVVRGTAGTAHEKGMLLSDACRGPVGMGEKGECVREVQRLLIDAGGDIEVTGRFIGDTRRLVVVFQTLAGLHDNGVVDRSTKQALYDEDLDVSLAAWDAKRVADRIREVFGEDAEQALRTAECQSLLEPLTTTSQADATRTWGVCQLESSAARWPV